MPTHNKRNFFYDNFNEETGECTPAIKKRRLTNADERFADHDSFELKEGRRYYRIDTDPRYCFKHN